MAIFNEKYPMQDQTFPNLLKHWRKHYGLSQLNLSLVSDVSAKHISFLESGRAKPSREMVLKIANALDLSLTTQNKLLMSAGFVGEYQERGLHQPDMQVVKKALDYTLKAQLPYPALIINDHWQFITANTAYLKLQMLLEQEAGPLFVTDNILELMFFTEGLVPVIVNFDEAAAFVLQRLSREVLNSPTEYNEQLFNRLIHAPNCPSNWREFTKSSLNEPVLHLSFKIQGKILRLFSTIATFGTAIDITVERLRIEYYFPMDETSENFFKRLAENT